LNQTSVVQKQLAILLDKKDAVCATTVFTTMRSDISAVCLLL